jgi:hypothetical protein
MKITLGGKISISLAVCIGGLFALLFLVPDDSRLIQEYGGAALYYLTRPVSFVCGLHGGHGGSQFQLVVFLLLLVPYCFLIGYAIAGVVYLIRQSRVPPPAQVPDDELRGLLDEHRKHDA